MWAKGSGMGGKGKGKQLKQKGKSKVLEGKSGVGASGEGHSDIRDKIIGAIQGMREGLPQLDERLAELKRYVEEQWEAECKKRVVEVLTDVSSFASPPSALVWVVEGCLEMCDDRAVTLKKWARGSANQFIFLSRVEGRDAKMLIIMSIKSLTAPKFVAVKQAAMPISMPTWTLCMARVVRDATLGHTIGISLTGTIKHVSITNQHNDLLIFGGYLNCGYWGR